MRRGRSGVDVPQTHLDMFQRQQRRTKSLDMFYDSTTTCVTSKLAEDQTSNVFESSTLLSQPRMPNAPAPPDTFSNDLFQMSSVDPYQLRPDTPVPSLIPVSPEALKLVLDLRDRAMGSRILLQNKQADYVRQRSIVADRCRRLFELLREQSVSQHDKSSSYETAEALAESSEQLFNSIDILVAEEDRMSKMESKLQRTEDDLWGAEKRLYNLLRSPKASNTVPLPSSSASTGSTSAAHEHRYDDYEVVSMADHSPAETPPLLRNYHRQLIDLNLLRQRLLNSAPTYSREVDPQHAIDNQSESQPQQEGQLFTHQDDDNQDDQAKMAQKVAIATDNLLQIRDQLLHRGFTLAEPSPPVLDRSTTPGQLLPSMGNFTMKAVHLGYTTPSPTGAGKADTNTRVLGWLHEIDSAGGHRNRLHSAPTTPYSLPAKQFSSDKQLPASI